MFLIIFIKFLEKEKSEKLLVKLENSGETDSAFSIGFLYDLKAILGN